MASEELGTIHELLSGFDLSGLTPRQRRAAMESVARPAPEGIVVDPVEANGVPAEWVAAAGGTHDDWPTYDRVMAEERRAVVMITPERVY